MALPKPDSASVEGTPENFDQLIAEPGKLVVVDFWGPGCPNCDEYAAAEPSLLQGFDGAPLRIVKVNAYEHEALARRFGIVGIPTFVLFREGKLVGKMSQYRGRDFWSGVVRDNLPGGVGPTRVTE